MGEIAKSRSELPEMDVRPVSSPNRKLTRFPFISDQMLASTTPHFSKSTCPSDQLTNLLAQCYAKCGFVRQELKFGEVTGCGPATGLESNSASGSKAERAP